jgi:hypothetical protein
MTAEENSQSADFGQVLQNRGGIFLYLVDHAAFIDRIEFGLWGTRRSRVAPEIQITRNIPIGGIGRSYARSMHGICGLSGNPFEFRYGNLTHWPSVPQFRLILRAETLPITGAQIASVAGGLLRGGFHAEASRVELTFDVSRFPFSYFRHHVLARAHHISDMRDDRGNETFYVGGPSSPWQLCIYQKRDQIVRLEFRLRRAFLHARNLERPHQLLGLRQAEVWHLVQIRNFREKALRAAVDAAPANRYKHLLTDVPRRWPLQTLIKFVRGPLGLNPKELLATTDAERMLHRMQENLIW